MMRDPRYNSGSYISHREGMRSLRGSKSRKDMSVTRCTDGRWRSRIPRRRNKTIR